jgi:molybdopterin/thiamine biosynthesis adenylyltransferase
VDNSRKSIKLEDGRFSRHELIDWWDQSILKNANVLVIGAGALGNEILKNLALLGVGKIFVIDFDIIEQSNLSRTVLFREGDLGLSKAEVAAGRVREIYRDVKIKGFHGNVVYDLGLGIFQWADIVICGVDNREARLEISRNCWKTTTPLIDGGIEGLDGQVRVFDPPDGPCYECTMSEIDWKLLEERRSCALLMRTVLEAGHVPTTAVASSIIAAIQCQEAAKWLHGSCKIGGKGIVYKGMTNEMYTVEYQKKEGCYGHQSLGDVVPLGAGVAEIRLGDLLDRAGAELGGETVIELYHDVLSKLQCPNCNTSEEKLVPIGRVTEDEAKCPVCRTVRIPHFMQILDQKCGLLDRTLASIGVPPFDIVTATREKKQVHFFLDGDAETVLGEIYDGN